MDDSEAGGYQSDGSIKSQAGAPSTSEPNRRNGSESQENFATQLASPQGARASDFIPASLHRGPALAKDLLSILGPGLRATSNVQAHAANSAKSPVEKALPTNERQSAREATPKATPKQIRSQSLRPERNNSDIQKDASKPREQTPRPAQKAPITLSQVSPRDHGGRTSSTGGSTTANGSHTNINITPLSQTKKGRKRKVDRSPEGSQTIGHKETGGSPHKRRKQSNLPPKKESDPSDPWYGMTRIRRRDVRIPKDQVRLLEDSPYWMPPAPGSPMPHCHVPPALLQQWNDTIIRKFSQSKDVPDRRPPSQIGSPPAPSSDVSSSDDLSQSASELESSWELSPPHHLRHPLLPPDSPPQRDIHTKSVEGRSRDNLPESPSSNKAREFGSETALVVDEREQEGPGKREEEREKREGPEEPEGPEGPEEQDEQDEQDDQNDESDESDMDMSVPRPLQSGSQQSETSAAVSSQSRPSQKSAHELQVVETPAADFERLRAKMFNDNTASKAEHRHSSQSTKIMATYGSSAPEISDCPPAEAYTQPEPAISNDLIENGSGEPGGSMLHSQMSLDSNSQSQQHEVEGSQHGQLIVQRRTRSPEESSQSSSSERPLSQGAGTSGEHENHSSPRLPSGSMLNSQMSLVSNSQSQHEQLTVQRRTGSPVGSSQSSSSQQHLSQGVNTSSDHENHSSPRLPSPDEKHIEGESAENVFPRRHPGVDQLGKAVAAPSLSQSNNEIQTDEISCSDPPTERYTGHISHEPKASFSIPIGQHTSSAETSLARAREAYETFRENYPPYNGDFKHFTRMCAKLEALWARGQLQRSYLWDDFIIRHLEDFPKYLEACISAVEEPCRYEDYFVRTFLKPLYKQRTLSAAAVKASAANCSPSTASLSGSFVTQSAANHSFTGSLVNQLSRLRTSSFQDTTNRSTPRSGSISRRESSS